MSGSRSFFGRVIRIDRESMRVDQPVSATSTFLARNNLQHLVDMSAQYRVAWAASTSDGDIVNQLHAYSFLATITDENTLPSFDLSVSARLTHVDADDGYVAASLVSTINISRTIHAFTEIPITSTTVTTSNQSVELAYKWERGADWRDDGLMRRYAYKDDSMGGLKVLGSPRSTVPLMLIVQAFGVNDDGYTSIEKVQLREYLSQ